MSAWDSEVFESFMAEAVRSHSEGDYQRALELREQAYDMAPENTMEKGRASRDTAACYDRLGQHDIAESWALNAYRIHTGLTHAMGEPTREAYRERSVSGMYVGVNGLRRYIREKLTDEYSTTERVPRDTMRRTWTDVKAAKQLASGINRYVDQYEINAARRVSIAESLVGRRRLGLSIGSKAVLLGFMSESPHLDTSSPELSEKERRRAKIKAVAGGIGAVSVGLLSLGRRFGTETTALKLADKVL